MPLNREQILSYTLNSEHVIALYRSAIGLGFWPDFPDYKVESLSWFLDKSEVDSLEGLDFVVRDNRKALTEYISHIYESSRQPWRVTPAFLCALTLVVKCPKAFSTEMLIEHGWCSTIAENVILSARKFSPQIV